MVAFNGKDERRQADFSSLIANYACSVFNFIFIYKQVLISKTQQHEQFSFENGHAVANCCINDTNFYSAICIRIEQDAAESVCCLAVK